MARIDQMTAVAAVALTDIVVMARQSISGVWSDYQATLGQLGAPVLNSGVVAFGTNQGTATALIGTINVLTTVTSGTGVLLPNAVPIGTIVWVVNRGANTALVYPPLGDRIEAGAVNAAVSLAANATARYLSTSATQWYSV